MAKDFKVTMNEYLPLRDVVFNTLRQAILKGEREPGERLMEIQLVERLGVSRKNWPLNLPARRLRKSRSRNWKLRKLSLRKQFRREIP